MACRDVRAQSKLGFESNSIQVSELHCYIGVARYSFQHATSPLLEGFGCFGRPVDLLVLDLVFLIWKSFLTTWFNTRLIQCLSYSD